MSDDNDYFQIDSKGVRPAPKDTKADLWGCLRLSDFMANYPDRLSQVSITQCARCNVEITYAHAETGRVNKDATKVCLECAMDALEGRQ